MKPHLSSNRNEAMTLFEICVVLLILFALAALLLPALSAAKRKSSRIGCSNCIKQISLSYRIWAGDNGDTYPMGISTMNGGSMELVQTGNVITTFMVISNELGTPKILLCPNDTTRVATNNFSDLSNTNISYFVGIDVTNSSNPRLILTGDCNFEINNVSVKSGLQLIETNEPLAWSTARHARFGYIGLNDGSVQGANAKTMRFYFQQTGVATNRLAIP